ncbi:chromosome segregation protein SMC [Oleiagrimonas citrea]|uniref:Chromosome partition protein Smc n=1 Tax=Oleiagrimonas citrea TaxID=1665687 RepID=A0A846ZH03_9GAMM|nr:chromosome segregation protein SMC [Oleiagrimonas citrea]NKZ37432.1 chromosome segregation protein SMC [Oleiagrimonas citrea]
MRLTTIKLAGFKSFVDPTTLHLPTNMTGVVGPNGCGKSNIIDAIRWVMGESAASRLRGDSLTDVIFSGSSARKPVGQAMVELIFDNSDGTVQGEFAQYAEISVKRTVSRDGQSQYFLNGSRCRRRDITDIFLGTGLGPRSYSIIEQGMISQIIDSHPDELRGHLEEAAGISKYKERRKETETRIRHTRENLERISDVREEVEKQLEHLNRQARAAERWKGYKEEQKRKQAELQALEYRGVRRKHESQGEGLRKSELEIEKFVAEQSELQARIESTREHHHAANEHMNEVQGEVYRIGAEIARVEQQVRHNQETAERLERAKADAEREHGELVSHLDADREQLATLNTALEEGTPKLETLREAKQATAEAQRDAEAKLSDWQERWDKHTGTASEASRAAEVERTRLDYLDRQALDLSRRREALQTEQRASDVEALAAAAETLASDHERQGVQVESLSAALEERKQAHEGVIERERETQAELNQTRHALQTASGRLSSLEALQHAALGQDEGAASEWLSRLGLDKARRLGEALKVEPGWETAVETVLAGMLDGVLVDDPHKLIDELEQLDDASITVVAQESAASTAGTLAGHVQGPAAAMALLAQVHTADSASAAQQRVADLSPQQSVITRDGLWLSPQWARVRRAGDNQVGVLAREREIQQLREQVQQLETRVEMLTEQLETLRSEKAEAERVRDDAQRELYTAHRRLSELAGQLQSHRGKVETARARAEKIEGELKELNEHHAALQEQTREARSRLDQTVSGMGDLEDRRRELDNERRTLLEAREEARMNARDASDQAHELALSLESRRSAQQSLKQSVSRMEAQLQQLQARREAIEQQLEEGSSPIAELEAERQACLDQRLLVDKKLVEARRAVEESDAQVRRLEQDRQQLEQTLQAKRESLSEKRMSAQALELRARQLEESIGELGLEPEALLQELAEDADASVWKKDLETLAQRIQRLEPVNLAAIQEYEEQAERKKYLDAQLEDLGSALETLENAIKKIDRETRQRFKETFDKVNAGMQELFPRLFGGGHGYLELTGDDLLNTGVTIMARPPGKRVSNITLLSGGEKAMTAVSLVFSIFALNPAPFCLLDEVDAPLDEANVGRFSNVVKEMSDRVQFLFVTHNKSTMEAAEQMCGVTMREPGVSRLVQVDLAEAARLAGAA